MSYPSASMAHRKRVEDARREARAEALREAAGIVSSEATEEAGAEFDRWLASVKAEAWDEGHDAGWAGCEDFAQHGSVPSGIHQSEAINPYREEAPDA